MQNIQTSFLSTEQEFPLIVGKRERTEEGIQAVEFPYRPSLLTLVFEERSERGRERKNFREKRMWVD